MKITYKATTDLPDGVTAALIEGDKEVVILLDQGASCEQVAKALHRMIGPWAQQNWIYVGKVTELRPTG